MSSEKSTKSVTESVTKTMVESKDNKIKLAGMIVEGVALVGASVTASAMGGKLGKAAYHSLKGDDKINNDVNKYIVA